MPITGLPTFSARDIPTSTQFNTWMATITAKFVSLVSTPDIQWPMRCGGNIDLAGNSILNCPIVGSRWNLTTRKAWATPESVLKEIEYFGGGIAVVEPNKTLTADAVDGSGRTNGFEVGSNTMLIGGGNSSVVVGIYSEDKENVILQDLNLQGTIRMNRCKNVTIRDCVFTSSGTYALDMRQCENVVVERCQFGNGSADAADIVFLDTTQLSFRDNLLNDSGLSYYLSKGKRAGGTFIVHNVWGAALTCTLELAGINRTQFEGGQTTYVHNEDASITVRGNTFYDKGQIKVVGVRGAKILHNLLCGTNTFATPMQVDDVEPEDSSKYAPGTKIIGNVICGTQNDNGLVVGSAAKKTNRNIHVGGNVINVPDMALVMRMPFVGAPGFAEWNGDTSWANRAIATVKGNVLVGADLTEPGFRLISASYNMVFMNIMGNNCHNGSTTGFETHDGASTPHIGMGYTNGYGIWLTMVGNQCTGLLLDKQPTPSTGKDFIHGGDSYANKIQVYSSTDDTTQINNY